MFSLLLFPQKLLFYCSVALFVALLLYRTAELLQKCLIYQETPDISEGGAFSHYQSLIVVFSEISMLSTS
ncbi:MAG: hypothetical protein WC855_12215 [Thermodesulfovibrionales bacterium]